MNEHLLKVLSVRNCRPDDHPAIISVMKEWWGGRDLRKMLPRLFLNHFADTSFIVEKEGELVGFLVGFLSPANRDEGYVHFAGVHPDYRGCGIGEAMFERFFGLCRKDGRTLVRSCTSPVNTGSIAFHKQLGFLVLEGDGEISGVPVTLDYNCPGDHKVLFAKYLSA